MSSNIGWDGGGSSGGGGGSSGGGGGGYTPDWSSSDFSNFNQNISINSGDGQTTVSTGLKVTQVSDSSYKFDLNASHWDLYLAPPTVGELPSESSFAGNDSSYFDKNFGFLGNITNPYDTPIITGFEVVDTLHVDLTFGGREQEKSIKVYKPTYEVDEKSKADFDNALADAKAKYKDSYNQAIKSKKDSDPRSDYDKAKEKEDEKKKGNWNWDFVYMQQDLMPYDDFSLLEYARLPSSTISDMYLEGDVYDWMAGGSLYDSQRAGDIFFHATGDLNSTVFLGLEDKNFDNIIDRDRNNLAELHRMLNVTAGAMDAGGDDTMFKLHMKRIADSIAYNETAKEINAGRINNEDVYVDDSWNAWDNFIYDAETHGWIKEIGRWGEDIGHAVQDGYEAVEDTVQDWGSKIGDKFGW